MVSATTSITTNTFTLNKKALLSSSSKKLSEHELNTKLTEIFNKIGKLDIAQQGIQELYDFLLEYPESDVKVNLFLASSGTFFQKYIRKALNDITRREMQKIGMIPATTTSPTTSLPSSPTSFSTSLPSSLTSSTTSLSSISSAENSLNDNDHYNNNDNNNNNNNDNYNDNHIISSSNTSNSNSQILPKKPPHKFIINRCPNTITNKTSIKEDKEISTASITNDDITTISSSPSPSKDISSDEILNTSIVNDEDKDVNKDNDKDDDKDGNKDDNSTKSKHTLSQEFLDNLTKETFEITRTRLFNIFQIDKYNQDNRRASLSNLETFKSDAERLENAKNILQTRFGVNPRRATWSGLSIQQRRSVF